MPTEGVGTPTAEFLSVAPLPLDLEDAGESDGKGDRGATGDGERGVDMLTDSSGKGERGARAVAVTRARAPADSLSAAPPLGLDEAGESEGKGDRGATKDGDRVGKGD